MGEYFKSLELKDLVTGIGILLTFFVGIINLVQSNKRMKLDNITQNRVEWINTLRKYMADYLTATDLANIQDNINNKANIQDIREKLVNITSLIRLHINFKGTIDKRMIFELEKLTNNIFIYSYLKLLS